MLLFFVFKFAVRLFNFRCERSLFGIHLSVHCLSFIVNLFDFILNNVSTWCVGRIFVFIYFHCKILRFESLMKWQHLVSVCFDTTTTALRKTIELDKSNAIKKTKSISHFKWTVTTTFGWGMLNAQSFLAMPTIIWYCRMEIYLFLFRLFFRLITFYFIFIFILTIHSENKKTFLHCIYKFEVHLANYDWNEY